jgi:hypothetical protein
VPEREYSYGQRRGNPITLRTLFGRQEAFSSFSIGSRSMISGPSPGLMRRWTEQWCTGRKIVTCHNSQGSFSGSQYMRQSSRRPDWSLMPRFCAGGCTCILFPQESSPCNCQCGGTDLLSPLVSLPSTMMEVGFMPALVFATIWSTAARKRWVILDSVETLLPVPRQTSSQPV